MPIGNLSDKISSSDLDRVRMKRNPPEYEEGFEPDGFDSVFDNDDMFGDNEFNNSNGFDDIFDSFDDGNSFDSGFDNGFGNDGWGNREEREEYYKEEKTTNFDRIMEASASGTKSLGVVFLESIKGIKEKTADDIGYLGRNYIIIGGILVGAGILLGIIGHILNVELLKFNGFGIQIIGCGGFTFCTGVGVMASAAIRIASVSKEEGEVEIEELPDIEEENGNIDNYEKNLEDILDSFDIDSTDMEEIEDDFEDEELDEELDDFVPNLDFGNFEEEKEVKEEIDYNKFLENIDRVDTDRRSLFSLFKPLLPLNAVGFNEIRELDGGDEEFEQISAICYNALSNVLNVDDFEDINVEIDSIKESLFSYEIKMTRIRGNIKPEQIARELEIQFRDSSDDYSVNAKVDILGKYYKIVITKGINELITLGDCIRTKEAEKYYLDEERKLPFIAGVDDYGKLLLVDGKNFPQILITGLARSGKSWYVLSILLSIMLFNNPEKVQFCIIDPKESNLFKSLALLPHVCGLHNQDNIIQILRDLIDIEAVRRKKLLSDNRCETIWDLKDKGIELPVLYVVIDEFMTVVDSLGTEQKELLRLVRIILTQLPSQGIFLMIVSHRATGALDKTIRYLMSYNVAVRALNSAVKESLDLKSWDRNLENPGDLALKMVGEGEAKFAKSVAIGRNDKENVEFIRHIANVFYKLDISLPDMKSLGSGYNRNNFEIKEELEIDNKYNKNKQSGGFFD